MSIGKSARIIQGLLTNLERLSIVKILLNRVYLILEKAIGFPLFTGLRVCATKK
jgi:hypothetical protein